MQRRRFLLLTAGSAVAACSGGGSEPVAVSTTTTTTTSTTTTTVPTTTTTTIPPAIAPLTGLPATEEVAARPVVAIKLDNTKNGRPQYGANEADLVYEVQVEGQTTRLLAVFHSQDRSPIGPVRSTRETDIPLLEELGQPIFCWHGANDFARAAVRRSSVIRASIDDVPGLFFREPSRPAPYNSFMDGIAPLRATKGADAPPPPQLLVYGADTLSPLAVPASRVTIRWPVPFGRGGGEQIVDYEWSAATGGWLRSAAGEAHVDSDGTRVAPQNVIVRFVQALDSGQVDTSGTRVPTARTVGEGDAWIFSRGTVVEGRWSKADNVSPCRYLDAAGNDVTLTPGRTWISLPYGRGSGTNWS